MFIIKWLYLEMYVMTYVMFRRMQVFCDLKRWQELNADSIAIILYDWDIMVCYGVYCKCNQSAECFKLLKFMASTSYTLQYS